MIPELLFNFAVVVGSAGWVALLLLSWRPCLTRESMDARPSARAADLSRVAVLVPARDEAAVIGPVLQALRQQGQNLQIIVIDDQSRDATCSIAGQALGDHGEVILGRSPPPGWSGKLWALEQGRRRVHRPLILLLDADIELAPGVVPALLERLEHHELELVSLLAWLSMRPGWERLLMPAYVFFFKLLYPFAMVNSHRSRLAAAAGGCVLLRRDALSRIGGFSSIRGALIDDCALAGRIKTSGGAVWIGLTRSARSLRSSRNLTDCWNLVSRTAYAQLRNSPWALLACSVAMISLFLGPLAGVIIGSWPLRIGALIGLIAMVAAYRPVLRYYSLSPGWAIVLPVTASLYLAMTWTSAVRHALGAGARWKGRSYPSGALHG